MLDHCVEVLNKKHSPRIASFHSPNTSANMLLFKDKLIKIQRYQYQAACLNHSINYALMRKICLWALI